MTVKIALIGLGKIAQDQHLPSLARQDGYELAAIVSRNASLDNIDAFTSIEDMIKARPDITAVSLCVPPQVRFDIAKTALKAGLDVMLEKPPGSTLSEVAALQDLAEQNGCSLFATWHSRFAAAVSNAQNMLKTLDIKSVEVIWKEDVRRWHPGQDWIWQPGGLGVFDPGINALSIVTEILPEKFYLSDGILFIPKNLHTPIAADLNFKTTSGIPVAATFDFLQTGPQTWDINIETDQGMLALSNGGAKLSLAGKNLVISDALASEYDRIYTRFADLLDGKKSDVDVAPLMHVADCFMLCKHEATDAFVE
ncbi:MAG: Gfo/Idh/MocA family oxidoreductase [Alphaproteobacteria bacterium]|nr:Gfo/Idh/MocA family oxidoreductase [Alphaproteobacteria bacterium]